MDECNEKENMKRNCNSIEYHMLMNLLPFYNNSHELHILLVQLPL